MLRKNVAGQFLYFQGVDATTGGIKSGVSWTIRRCLDGTFAAATGTVSEDGTTGWYKFAASQADTNGNNVGFNFTGTGAVPVTLTVITTACDPTSAAFGLSLAKTTNITGFNDLTAAQIATGVWQDTTAGDFTVASSIGKSLKTAGDTAPGNSNGLLISGSNSGTTTLGALTVTGATTHTGNMLLSAGLTINQSTGNASAVAITGNGTGHGIVATSGSGVTGDGIRSVAASTNGHGITGIKTGTGSDLNCTSTPLTLAKTTNITGLNDIAATAVVSSGAITTSGGAVSTVTTATNVTTVNGLAANVITATSIASGALTAAKFAAGAFDAVWTVTTRSLTEFSTALAVSVWDVLASAVATASSIGLQLKTNIDAAVTSRMASYTQPTGFLAATFPTTVASTTNITAGTITTVTNLTNAPTNGDLTATMKTSVTTACTASTPTVAAVTGAVGSVTGSVGSVLGGINTTAGVITTLDGLDTAQDTQHATTQGLVTTVYTVADAIKGQTDQLTFTVANQVDSNIQYVNDVQVTGNGQPGTEWGPA